MSIKLMAQTMDGCSILNKLLRKVQLWQESDGNATNCQNVSIFTIKNPQRQHSLSTVWWANQTANSQNCGVGRCQEVPLCLVLKSCSWKVNLAHTPTVWVCDHRGVTLSHCTFTQLYTVPGMTRPWHNAWLDRPLHNAWLDRPLHNAWLDIYTMPGLTDLYTMLGLTDLYTMPGLIDFYTTLGLTDLYTMPGLRDLYTMPGLIDIYTMPLHNAHIDRPLHTVWLFFHPQPTTLACCWHNHENCSLYKAIRVISSWRHFKKEKDLGGYHANCSQRTHRIMWGWLYTPLSQAHEYVLHHTPALTD